MFSAPTAFQSQLHRMICLIFILLPVTASANSNDEWEFSVTPFFWVTGQKGDVSTLPPAGPAKIDISFNDIIENLDSALMGFFEARKGRFGIFSEVYHAGISVGADTPGPLFSGSDYEQDIWAIALGGIYQLTRNDQYQLDALLGIRYWDLDNTLDLDAGSLPASKVSEREQWADITIGFKGQTKLNENCFLSGMVNFAVAGDSDSYWDVFGGVNYQYSDTITLLAGYRYQEVDYDEGNFLFDTELSGPVLGFKVNF